MEKTKIWNVPEGYELDKEQSTETKVVLARAFEDSGHKAEGEQMQTAFFIFLKINIRKVTGRNLDFNGGLYKK